MTSDDVPASAGEPPRQLQRLADRLREQTGASRTTVRGPAGADPVALLAESLAPGVESMRDGQQPAAIVAAPTYIELARTRAILIQHDCRRAARRLRWRAGGLGDRGGPVRPRGDPPQPGPESLLVKVPDRRRIPFAPFELADRLGEPAGVGGLVAHRVQDARAQQPVAGGLGQSQGLDEVPLGVAGVMPDR